MIFFCFFFCSLLRRKSTTAECRSHRRKAHTCSACASLVLGCFWQARKDSCVLFCTLSLNSGRCCAACLLVHGQPPIHRRERVADALQPGSYGIHPFLPGENGVPVRRRFVAVPFTPGLIVFSSSLSFSLQVFYVVPRINQIEEAWQQISRCVPDARVAVGHSKVSGDDDIRFAGSSLLARYWR